MAETSSRINPVIPEVDPVEFQGMKVAVIDNGGQWTHREWRVLRYLGCDATIVPNDTDPDDLQDFEALVLSGGAPRISEEAPALGRIGEYLDDGRWPVLGICVGLQLLAEQYGGEAGAAEVPEYGKAEMTITEPGRLFAGLPDRLTVWESHNDEIKKLPAGFRALAHSADCEFEAIEHDSLPLMGVQFHPEVEHTEGGYAMFANFLRVAREWEFASVLSKEKISDPR